MVLCYMYFIKSFYRKEIATFYLTGLFHKHILSRQESLMHTFLHFCFVRSFHSTFLFAYSQHLVLIFFFRLNYKSSTIHNSYKIYGIKKLLLYFERKIFELCLTSIKDQKD